jgi:hypothetical protein
MEELRLSEVREDWEEQVWEEAGGALVAQFRTFTWGIVIIDLRARKEIPMNSTVFCVSYCHVLY